MTRPLLQFGPFQIGWSHLFCVAGLGLLLPVGLLVGFALVTPITTSGLWYTLGAVGITAGLLVAPWRTKWSVGLVAGGFSAILLTACVRLYVGGSGTVVQLISLPDSGGTQWVDRLIHEQDLSLFGQRAASLTGIALSRRESAGLNDALAQAYERMAAVDATTSSPVFATYLLMQSPNAFDTVVVEPPGPAEPQAAVIYLHGFTGNFCVQAWLIAEAARKLNLLTVAPSTGFIGNWWTSRGEETLRRTIAHLHRRGIRRIYVAGLSNGAAGICRLAPKFKSDLNGLILISGADPYTPDPQLPVLVLHGEQDERMPIENARQYAKQFGDRVTLREAADGDHLLLAKKSTEMQAEMERWLREQEAAAK